MKTASSKPTSLILYYFLRQTDFDPDYEWADPGQVPYADIDVDSPDVSSPLIRRFLSLPMLN